MAQRKRLYGLLAVLASLVAVLYYSRTEEPPQPSVLSADTRFTPLSVKEPELRIDLLEQLQKQEYTGSRRNIFIAEALPPPAGAVKPVVEAPRPFVGPRPPPPPPPVEVPAEFFGYESAAPTGKRVAFFREGDNVIVVGEGEMFLNRFRLVRIGNNSADVLEISTGRHANVPLVPSADAPNQG